jgi:hypothetical protein
MWRDEITFAKGCIEVADGKWNLLGTVGRKQFGTCLGHDCVLVEGFGMVRLMISVTCLFCLEVLLVKVEDQLT